MFSFWFSGFRVYICAALLLAAAQKCCFCWIKRKPRLKPAKFFIASKIAEGGILPAFSEGRPQGKVRAGSLQTIVRLGCRLTGTSKAAASRPLTAT